MTEIESYLRGEWVRGAARIEVWNPTTEAPIGWAPSGPPNLDGVVEFARTVGGPALRGMTFAERGAMLKAVSKALHAHREALIEVSILSGGTTRSDAKFDLDGASGTLAYYASLGEKLGASRWLVEPSEQLLQDARFHGQHVWLSRRGVAFHVNAFNFPAWGLAEKLAVALLAGVPVISKPATSTSLLAYEVAKRIVECGALPHGAFQFLAGSAGDLIERLGAEDVVAFTGSADTGARLRAAKSVVERSTRINIEADSLNSAVLAPDAGDDPYRIFLRDVVKEMTQKSGQKCTATRRIFVPRPELERVVTDLSGELARITVGDPASDDTRMGPLATRQQQEDFRAGVARLEASGAKVVFRHPFSTERGFFVAPVLLVAETPDRATAVHAHEVFGPCATVCPYDSIEACVALVAQGQGGLVSTIYGDSKEAVRELVLGIAPLHGRVLVVSSKVADKAISPGLVLPSCVHGGPGRAGGGEELGGERGLRFYMQRTAIQGDRALLDRFFEGPKA